jgi:beta-fructofuranosidase
LLKLNDSWVWDSWYAFDGENHHAFYLRASRALGDPHRRHRQPYIGHAISKDLKNWTVVQDAVAISDPPAFDSWTTWTGSVIKGDDGLWWMFYTGTSREDGGDVQRVGAAKSKDLLSWKKVSSEALVEADPKQYEMLDYAKWHDQAWRDPWVFKHEDGKWHMFITARVNDDSLDTRDRGTLGHAVSTDLMSWEVQPPLISGASGFGQLEVFQIEEIDGKAVLIWCCGTDELSAESKAKFGEGGMFSVTGESLTGPFDMTKVTRFPHPSLYAARAVQHEGKWFMLGFINEVDGKFVGEICDPIPIKVSGTGLTIASD